MKVLLYLLAAAVAYLVAAVNPAILFSRLVYHEDIRTKGSKNPGFTNFKRVYGNKWAWWVLLFDLLKGAAVALLFAFLFAEYEMGFSFGAAYTGVFALLGHSLPVWYGFKGGKGFLTYLSVVFVIDWRAGLIAVGVMLLLLLTTKYMSLSTVAAMLSCPIMLWVFGAAHPVIVLCAACVLVITVRHKENFKRLLAGTENKFKIR